MKQKRTIRDIAPPIPATDLQSGREVWLLNLDQIEPHTGRLLGKSLVDRADVGSSTNAFDEGNVLYSKLRPYLNKVYLPEASGFCTSELVPLRPNPSLVTREYLAAYLRSPKFLAWVDHQVDGAKMPRVSMKIFWDHEIDLPLLEEQKRITTILDMGAAVCRKRQQAVHLVDDFLRSEFLEMFGDPGSNNRHWPERAIVEVSAVTTGNTPSRNDASYYGDFIEWIKSDNINTPSHLLTRAHEGLSELGASIARTAPAGSTLMTCIAGSPGCIGNVALSDRKVAFNQQINAITPAQGVEPEFLYALLLFSKARIQATSTNSMKGMVSKGVLEKVRLIWPASELQENFVKVFRQVQRVQSSMEDAVASPLMSALQNKLFA